MAVTEFDDSRDFAFFLRDSQTLRNGNGYAVRWSEITLAALRSAGVLDNMEDGTTPPATDKLWLDKNTDPAGLKEWDSIASAWVPVDFDRMFGRAVVTALTIAGGTANAVVVAQPANFISDRLYTLTPQAENVEGGVTIQVVGVGTYPVVYPDGGEIGAKELSSARPALLLFRNGRFEIIWAAAPFEAILTAAKAARDAAAQSAAEASDILADTLLRSDLQQGATSAARQTDTTDGRVLTVGSFGVGDWLDLRTTVYQTGTPADVAAKGRTVGFADGGGTGLAIPGLANYSYGMLVVDGGRTSADGELAAAVQRTFSHKDREWRQCALNATTWGNWREMGGVADFTASEVAAIRVPDATEAISTTGYSDPGDGGEATYVKQAGVPAHSGYVTDAGGQVFAIMKRTVRASQFGAFPSETVDQGPAVQRALEYLDEIGGGCLEIDHDEDYLVGSGISLDNPTSTITMENKAGGVLKAQGGLTDAILAVGAVSDGTVLPARFHGYDIKLNNSLGAFVVGDASCTGARFRWLTDFHLENFECIGGYDPLVGVTGSGGDSGVASVGCEYGEIVNPHITGQPDAGIYPSWDNSGTVRGTIVVKGGRISRSVNCISAKRNLEELFVYGGKYSEADAGILSAWVNNGGFVHPVRNMHIEGVKFEKILSNVVRSRANTKLVFRNSEIVDIGYKINGTGGIGANARAIQLLGSPHAVIENISLEMKDWTPNNEYVFYEDHDTASGTLTSGGHSVRGLTMKNFSRFLVGINGQVNAPSLFNELFFIDCPTTNRFVNSSTAALFRYYDDGNYVQQEFRNGA